MLSMNEGQPEILGLLADSGHRSSSDSDSNSEEDYDSEPYDYGVECYCGRKAKKRISRTRKNPSRPFFCCPIKWYKKTNCGFFQWTDEPLPHREKHANDPVKQANDEDSGYDGNTEEDYDSEPYFDDVECYCGREAKLRISGTEKNPSRPFFCCPLKSKRTNCGFFQWTDEPLPYREKHANDAEKQANEESSGCCSMCKRKMDDIESDVNDDRASSNREKTEEIQILALQSEVYGFRKRIKIAHEFDLNLMPPNSEEEEEDEDSM